MREEIEKRRKEEEDTIVEMAHKVPKQRLSRSGNRVEDRLTEYKKVYDQHKLDKKLEYLHGEKSQVKETIVNKRSEVLLAHKTDFLNMRVEDRLLKVGKKI